MERARMEKIYTENPEEDIWKEILQFSYEENVIRYLEANGKDRNTKLVNCITGSVLQAYEYFKASKTADLQILPLLLYYGTTNLLYGAVSLMEGNICNIINHGMRPDHTKIKNYIGEAEVAFFNHDDGGMHVFAKSLGFNEDLTKLGTWSLKEFLASIPEINSDYKRCYSEKNGKTLLLDVFETENGMVEKIYVNSENREETGLLLNYVEGYTDSYLSPQNGVNMNGDTYLILRHKLNHREIAKISISGQPYLIAATEKNGKKITLPTELILYASLFIMGSLCRYHPEIWSPFVLKDTTGEKLLIEKSLTISQRVLPNLILDRIYGQKNIYSSEKYRSTKTYKFVGEHEVKELIRKEVSQQYGGRNFR